MELSLWIRGALHANADGSNRMFEIAMLSPGDRVALVPEPTNKADSQAVAVYSIRGYQIGYLSAERCGLIGARIRGGCDVIAVFQQKTADGAVIRVNLNGQPPALLPTNGTGEAAEPPAEDFGVDREFEFYPDFIPPDE